MDGLQRRACEAMARLGQRRPRQRIPDDVRDAVLEFARSRREHGVGWAAIAKTVGLSPSALIRWSAGKPKHTRRHRRVMPVEIIEESASNSTANGIVFVVGDYRIEGLDIAAAAELLRRLL